MEMLFAVRWLLNGVVLSHVSGMLNAVNVFLEQKHRVKKMNSRKSFGQIQLVDDKRTLYKDTDAVNDSSL